MSDEGGAARRRGLFRRNRAGDDLIDRDPLVGDVAELPPPDEDEVAMWEQVGSNRPRVPKRTADMFAPKESFNDTWSEDAWDDEWKEPAVRRTSIPPAADPTPQKVDEWLESGAEQFDDVTRDAVRKLGVDPALAAARAVRPGSTWDDTGDVAADAVRTADPALQATIERALSTQPPAAPVDTARTATPSKRFGRSRSTLDVTEPTDSSAPDDEAALASAPADTTADTTATTTATTTAEAASDTLDTGMAPAEQAAAQHGAEAVLDVTDGSAHAHSAELDASSDEDFSDENDAALTDRWERPIFNPVDLAASESDVPDGTVEAIDLIDSEVNTEPTELNDELEHQPATAQATETENHADADIDESARSAAGVTNDDFADDSDRTSPGYLTDDDEEIEMDKASAHAFTDRASWIGTGLAGIAVLRLALHVASGMKQSDPAGSTIDAFTRLGSGFAGAGVMHGLLLVAAVTLLSLPALFNRDDLIPRRTGGGLGLVLGAALVGLIGAVVALLTQSTLADALGTRTTLGGTGEIIAAIALAVVALGATMRALRSYVD